MRTSITSIVERIENTINSVKTQVNDKLQKIVEKMQLIAKILKSDNRPSTSFESVLEKYSSAHRARINETKVLIKELSNSQPSAQALEEKINCLINLLKGLNENELKEIQKELNALILPLIKRENTPVNSEKLIPFIKALASEENEELVSSPSVEAYAAVEALVSKNLNLDPPVVATVVDENSVPKNPDLTPAEASPVVEKEETQPSTIPSTSIINDTNDQIENPQLIVTLPGNADKSHKIDAYEESIKKIREEFSEHEKEVANEITKKEPIIRNLVYYRNLATKNINEASAEINTYNKEIDEKGARLMELKGSDKKYLLEEIDVLLKKKDLPSERIKLAKHLFSTAKDPLDALTKLQEAKKMENKPKNTTFWWS